MRGKFLDCCSSDGIDFPCVTKSGVNQFLGSFALCHFVEPTSYCTDVRKVAARKPYTCKKKLVKICYFLLIVANAAGELS